MLTLGVTLTARHRSTKGSRWREQSWECFSSDSSSPAAGRHLRHAEAEHLPHCNRNSRLQLRHRQQLRTPSPAHHPPPVLRLTPRQVPAPQVHPVPRLERARKHRHPRALRRRLQPGQLPVTPAPGPRCSFLSSSTQSAQPAQVMAPSPPKPIGVNRTSLSRGFLQAPITSTRRIGRQKLRFVVALLALCTPLL